MALCALRMPQRKGPRGGVGLGSVSSQVFYLPVYFIQRLADAGFQPCSPVVGEIAGKGTCLFQEHAHVA
jgi:hypothetical protein